MRVRVRVRVRVWSRVRVGARVSPAGGCTVVEVFASTTGGGGVGGGPRAVLQQSGTLHAPQLSALAART